MYFLNVTIPVENVKLSKNLAELLIYAVCPVLLTGLGPPRSTLFVQTETFHLSLFHLSQGYLTWGTQLVGQGTILQHFIYCMYVGICSKPNTLKKMNSKDFKHFIGQSSSITCLGSSSSVSTVVVGDPVPPDHLQCEDDEDKEEEYDAVSG